MRLTPNEIKEVMWNNRSDFVKIFHSADLGASWTEIWRENQDLPSGVLAGITVLAAENALGTSLTQSRSKGFRGGCCWKNSFCWYRERSLPSQFRHLGKIAIGYKKLDLVPPLRCRLFLDSLRE